MFGIKRRRKIKELKRDIKIQEIENSKLRGKQLSLMLESIKLLVQKVKKLENDIKLIQ